jgi:hypothetical protein
MYRISSALNGKSNDLSTYFRKAEAKIYSLVSSFTIASDGREVLRVGSVQLKAPEGDSYRVEASRSEGMEDSVCQC